MACAESIWLSLSNNIYIWYNTTGAITSFMERHKSEANIKVKMNSLTGVSLSELLHFPLIAKDNSVHDLRCTPHQWPTEFTLIQFRASAPQHLPQLCATQQKPREAQTWASVAHHAVTWTPVMTQYLEGRKQGQTSCWQGHLTYIQLIVAS